MSGFWVSVRFRDFGVKGLGDPSRDFNADLPEEVGSLPTQTPADKRLASGFKASGFRV